MVYHEPSYWKICGKGHDGLHLQGHTLSYSTYIQRELKLSCTYPLFDNLYSLLKTYLHLRNNNSIKLTTLEALAAKIRHVNPELICLFEKLS